MFQHSDSPILFFSDPPHSTTLPFQFCKLWLHTLVPLTIPIFIFLILRSSVFLFLLPSALHSLCSSASSAFFVFSPHPPHLRPHLHHPYTLYSHHLAFCKPCYSSLFFLFSFLPSILFVIPLCHLRFLCLLVFIIHSLIPQVLLQ